MNEGFALLQTQSPNLQDHDVVVEVGDEPRQAVALGVDDAEAIRWLGRQPERPAHGEGAADSGPEERSVEPSLLVSYENAHRNSDPGE